MENVCPLHKRVQFVALDWGTSMYFVYFEHGNRVMVVQAMTIYKATFYANYTNKLSWFI